MGASGHAAECRRNEDLPRRPGISRRAK
jgi:hypothetical protein